LTEAAKRPIQFGRYQVRIWTTVQAIMSRHRVLWI